MRPIIITGSIAFDHIMNIPEVFSDYIMPDKIHMLNVSFYANQMRREMGGTGGNIAYTMALLGLNPVLLSAAGNDFDKYKTFLEKKGVNTKYIKIISKVNCSTGFCLTDKNDNQIWGFSGGALDFNNKLSLKKFAKQKPFVILSPSGLQGISHFIDECVDYNLDYLFDPAFYIPTLSLSILNKGIKHAKILIGNDYEIALLKKRTGLNNKALLKNGKIVITTLGSKGSKIEAAGKTYLIPPAKPKNETDPTGAGDAFRAGFMAGYLKGLDLSVCGRMGSVAAVYTVEKYGTTTHKYSVSEFNSRVKKNFGIEINL